jgi:glutamyl-tRNA synthetase
MGKPLPEFAHLPLILGPDKQRLSKRHGATSVTAYRDMGYLPDAFFNFLSLLGWSPGDDRELLARGELIELFSLEGVGKADAVFGLEKLDWFNSQYLRNASMEVLQNSLDPRLLLLQPRARKLADFSTIFKAFFTDAFDYDTGACSKFLKDPKLKNLIPALRERYAELEEFTLQSTEETLRRLAEEEGVKAGLIINAARVALTGQAVAPGLFEIMLVLGREITIDRLQRLSEYLSAGAKE